LKYWITCNPAKMLERGGDFQGAMDRVTECLGYCPSSSKLVLWKAKLLALSKKLDECDAFMMKAITSKIIKDDENSPEQRFIKGICLYYDDDDDGDFESKAIYDHFFEAQKELKEADPWFKKIKEMRECVDKIKENFEKQKKKEAIQVATRALKIDPNHKKFNFNILNKRAALNRLCSWPERAIEDLTLAIAIDDTNSDCFYRRGGLYFELKKLEEASADLKKACELDPDQPQYNALMYRIVSKINKMQKAKTKDDEESDHYKVLGVERSASMQQIREAYKEKARTCHPDKHSNSSKDVQEKMEAKMKSVSSAYSCLSNHRSRNYYDMMLDDAASDSDDGSACDEYEWFGTIYDDDDNDDDDDDDYVDIDEYCGGFSHRYGNGCGCCHDEEDGISLIDLLMMFNQL